MKKVEYRVRPVTRFVVTRYEEESLPDDGGQPRVSGGVITYGEFDHEAYAMTVMDALHGTEPCPNKSKLGILHEGDTGPRA